MSRPKFELSLLFVLFASVPVVASAQVEGNPENWCRNGLYTHDAAGFRVGHVVGAKGARAYFFGDASEDCPGAGAKCRQRAYVLPGDAVVVSRRLGDYVCAWFAPARGPETVGWLRAEQVSLSEADAGPPLARWLGAWEYAGQSLDIRRGKKAGALAVSGQAFWRGQGDNVHVGEVEFEAAPAGNVLKLEENEDLCSVRLQLVGPFLVVSDNLKCGGLNVTFNGIYRKKQ
ncbi:MAG TPA: hypothetical protein VF064_10180 [Pyrinomonadaceae bacterium]